MGPLSRENLFTELDKMLKAPSMEEEGYTPASVKAFVQINRRLLSSSLEDNVLSTKLKILSHKISEEFTDQKGINLAHEIHNIAQSLILPPKGRDAPELPPEMWAKIAEHTMEDARIFEDYIGAPPNLKAFSPLGAMKGIKTGINPTAEYVEARIIEKQSLSLKTICKDADAAIAYAIANKLSFINLKDFPDLETRHLDQLFAEAKHNIEGLVLKTDHPIEIKKWPEGLKTITLACKNLVSFPPLPNSLKGFSISGASHPIQIQGPYPSLERIFINGDSYSLDGSPMPKLKFAHIVSSGKLASLPNDLPELTILFITNETEDSLTPLPERMPKLTSLTLVGEYATRLFTPRLGEVVKGNKGDYLLI